MSRRSTLTPLPLTSKIVDMADINEEDTSATQPLDDSTENVEESQEDSGMPVLEEDVGEDGAGDVSGDEVNGHEGQEYNLMDTSPSKEEDDAKIDVDLFDFVGRCETCGAGLVEGKDHMEFLLERLVAPTREGPYRRFISKHWPEFSQYSLKMQPFCKCCKLHFWGIADFVRHICNMAKLGVEHWPEQYFNADTDTINLSKEADGLDNHKNNLLQRDRVKVQRLLDGAIRMEGKFFFPPKKDNPSDEEKEKRKSDHMPLYENILEVLHTVEDGVAKKEAIPLLEPLLCKCSPRWFVSAYLSGSYETPEVKDNFNSARPGHMDTGMHLHTALADLLAKRSMGELSHEDYNEKVKVLTSAAGLEERRKELERKMEERRQLSGGHTQGKPIKCMRCDEGIVNLRWHLEDVLWFRDYERTQHKAHRGRWDHVRNYFGQEESERLQTIASTEETNTVTPKCPACNLHFRSARGIQHLLYHVQTSAFVQGDSEYKQKHLEVAERITQDVIDARAGVQGRSVTNIVDSLIDYLTCKEGGFYSYRVVRHLHVLRRHAELKNRLKRRRDVADGPSSKKSRGRFFGRGGQRANARMEMGSFGQGQPLMTSNQVGVYCELCTQEFYGTSFQEANSYLHNHLLDMLFKARKGGGRGSQQAVSTHLSCFPLEMVYNKRCRCPTCGQNSTSLDHALNHICMVASGSGIKAQPHMQAANQFVNKYIECMSGGMNLNQLANVIRQAFDMQG